MEMKSLRDLFVGQLQNLYRGEVSFDKYLKELHVAEPRLKWLLADYKKDTVVRILNLEQMFDTQHFNCYNAPLSVMEAVVNASRNLVDECVSEELRDVAVVLSLQHIIHYKVATYEVVSTYARLNELWDEVLLLLGSLQMEQRMDDRLTAIASDMIDAKFVASRTMNKPSVITL